MFFKREILITYELKHMNEIRDMLASKGIKTHVGYGDVLTSSRKHGVPCINGSASHLYRIYVGFRDYEKAKLLLKNF